jgi:hypothetical protein
VFAALPQSLPGLPPEVFFEKEKMVEKESKDSDYYEKLDSFVEELIAGGIQRKAPAKNRFPFGGKERNMARFNGEEMIEQENSERITLFDHYFGDSFTGLIARGQHTIENIIDAAIQATELALNARNEYFRTHPEAKAPSSITIKSTGDIK